MHQFALLGYHETEHKWARKITESQNGGVGRDVQRPGPSTRASSARSDGPEMCSDGSGISAEVKTPQPLWAAGFSILKLKKLPVKLK